MQGSRVAVFMGGKSSEHDISIASGTRVMEALQAEQPLSVVVERDGRWIVGGEPQRSAGVAIDLVRSQADVAFLAFHGPFGEDGTIQGFLEVHGLPYTGSGVLASALAMDKPRTKMMYRHRGLTTPDFVLLDQKIWADRRAALIHQITSTVGYPCVVKPARFGSSVGISFPKTENALAAAIDQLLDVSEDVLAERFVSGRELTCGVLSIDRESRTFALPPTEIVPNPEFEFFDYKAKYTPGATHEITPARVSPEVTAEVQRMALEAHLVLGCRDCSRSDFIVTADGRPHILETNTIPGFTATSLLPQGAAAIGIDYGALVHILIENARRRAA